MSQQRRKQQGRRNRNRNKGGGGDLWRPVPPPAEPRPIAPADDPTALLRSLGEPPLQAQATAAEHYLAHVVERAAGVATALSAAAGLLATDEPAD